MTWKKDEQKKTNIFLFYEFASSLFFL